MFKSILRTLALLVITIFGVSISLRAQADTLVGTWQSIGYGLWFTVEEDAVNIYQMTDASCLHFANVPEVLYEGQSILMLNVTLAGLSEFLGASDYELTLTDGLLNFDVGKFHPIQAERADSLPVICAEMTANSPESSFDTFWHIFNENYAFFGVRGVDWSNAYETYRPRITPETSEEELFAVFQEMIAPLGDGHVAIITPFDSFSPLTLPAWFEGEEEAIAEYAMLTANNYLAEAPGFTDNETVLYGKLSDTVGYINLLTFDGLRDDDGHHDQLAESMSMILDEFDGFESIVIDVRFNLGGFDTSGFFVAGHFTDEPYPVFSKSVWFNNNFHPIMDIYVEPTTNTPFTGDVYLLTSGMTLSAAETFTMAMRALPNVTVVGEPTNGMLSDAWFYILPNGWVGTLSNEQYLDAEGVLYEGLGVPPDVEISMTGENFVTGSDPIVEAVLDLAR